MNMSRSYGAAHAVSNERGRQLMRFCTLAYTCPTGLVSRQAVRGSLTMKPPDCPPVAVIGARYSRTMRSSTPFVDLALQMMSGGGSPAQQSTIFGPHLQTFRFMRS